MTMRIKTALAVWILAVSAVHADPTRWFETESWSGKGMRTTEPFHIQSDTWRILARRSQAEPRRLFVYDSEGNEVARMLVLKRGVTALKTLKGKGEYHLVIPEEEGQWSLRIQQKLSVVEEWELRQKFKQSAPSLKKISSWSGEDGLSRFSFTVPAGKRWRLVCSGETGDEGAFDLRVTQLGTTRKNDFIYGTDGRIDCTQWFLNGGEFELTIESVRGTWQAEVQTE